MINGRGDRSLLKIETGDGALEPSFAHSICFTELLFHWPGWLNGSAVATNVAVRFDLDECSLFCPRLLLEAVEVGVRALSQTRPS